MRTSIALTLSVSCLIGGAAFAGGISFMQFDRNKNGRVIAGEISAQVDAEVIAAMDVNNDGAVTPDEWQSRGRGSSYVEKSSIDARGITHRWLEFRVVFFSLDGGVVATQLHEGQAQLAAVAVRKDIEVMWAILDARFIKEQDS